MRRVLDLVGKPFQDGGRGPDAYDCVGLVKEVYKRYGLDFPDYVGCCYDIEKFDSEFKAALPFWVRHDEPDIPVPAIVAIRFNAPVVNHVGVYLGDGKFIHTREKTGVVIELMRSLAWRHRIEGIYTCPSLLQF